MYKNGEAALQRILELVANCPKELQEKCFEVLLSGYVQIEVGASRPQSQAQGQAGAQAPQQTPRTESHIPPAISTRFKKTAKHLGIGLEELESILDFSVDPFTLRAVTLPGKKTAEKTRQVALLAASRSYLATGLWSADWQEVKSLCVDHNCYDIANHALIVKRAASKLFKGAEAGKPIELPSGGIQAAERLLKGLSEPAT